MRPARTVTPLEQMGEKEAEATAHPRPHGKPRRPGALSLPVWKVPQRLAPLFI